MPIVKAAAVQISPVLYSREGTVGKVVKKIIELGRQGVQFATFPETVIPYYPYFSFVEAPYLMGAEHYKLLDQAVTVPSDTTRAIGEAAGLLATFCIGRHLTPRAVRNTPARLQEFQAFLTARGVEIDWPRLSPR